LRSNDAAAVLAALALGSGLAVFLLTTLLVYTILTLVCGAFVHSVLWLGLASLALTAGFYARTVKGRQDNPDLGSDPTGSWIITLKPRHRDARPRPTPPR
jgi:hypothetical protein